MAIPYQNKSNGATRHSNRLRRGKVFVASAAAAGLAAIGAGGALVATASNAAAVTNVVTVSVNASAPGGVDNPSVTANVPDNYYDLDVKSATGEVQWYVNLKGGVPDSNGFTFITSTGTISCGQGVTYQLLIVQTEGNPLAASGDVTLNGCRPTPSINTPTIQGVCGTSFTNGSGVDAFADVQYKQTGSGLPAGSTAVIQLSGPDAAVGQVQTTVGNDGSLNVNKAVAADSNTGWWVGKNITWYVRDLNGKTYATGKVKLGTDCTGGTPPPPSCESSDKDSNGSTTAWYSDLSWTVNGKAYSSAQKALDAAQPGDKIVLTGNADIPANCTTQALAALYLVPKSSNQILLDSQVVKPESGKSFTLTVTLPVPPNDLVSCNEKYTLQYDSGVGEVLPIIGTDKGKTYLYGKRKFENGYGKASFTAPPCQTETPTPSPTPTHTYTPPPVTTSPTPSPTPTSSPSPSPSSSPTPSASPTVAPSPSSSPYVPGPGNTGDSPLNSGPNGQLMAGGLVIIAGLVFVGLAIAEAFGRRPRSGVSD